MAIQRQEQQASQQVQARHKDEIEAAMKKYREEHAPKPRPNACLEPPCGSVRRRAPVRNSRLTGSHSAVTSRPATTTSAELSTKGCMSIHKKPLVLAILDGWGYRAQVEANAIALARKPTYDKLLAEYPNTLLHASDHFVGLPDGQMGNSEVGHLNIGAGRIVRMDITRIDALIASGEFFSNPVIADAMKRAA